MWRRAVDLELADSMGGRASGIACDPIRTAKLFPCTQAEAVGIVETLWICRFSEAPGHLDSCIHPLPLERDALALRQSLSYPPLNWWRGSDGVNWENAAWRILGPDFVTFLRI